ncbi:MAG: bile acid:sodium symporter family protein [Rhodospirillales bacterium]|nr:MAG: bile acid:sodium symporter family protein [Rhodospirillales bacterium]
MISQVLLPAALAFIMFAMGLTMALGDFKQVFTQPKALLTGLASKLLLVPLLGMLIVMVFVPPADFAAGMMILAACPAGVTSSLLTHHAGGRIALAASVTALTSIAAVVTLPLIANLGLLLFAGFGEPVDLPVGKMAFGIFLVDTLPLALGLAMQKYLPALALRLGRIARPLATLLFAIIVVWAFASQLPAMLAHGSSLLLPSLALNLTAMLGAWLAAYGMSLTRAEHLAVIMENGLQNSALGIFVAISLLQNEAMMAPSIIYAFVMNLTAIAVIAYLKRPSARSIGLGFFRRG